MRMAERVDLVDPGRSKSAGLLSLIVEVSYPISIPLHVDPLHQPNTPKSTPISEPSGMAGIRGVERTEIRRRPKATNSRTDNGVAGRNMLTKVGRLLARWSSRKELLRPAPSRRGKECRQQPAQS